MTEQFQGRRSFTSIQRTTNVTELESTVTGQKFIIIIIIITIIIIIIIIIIAIIHYTGMDMEAILVM